jgi:uncharacterized protein (DUF2252 family)
MVKSPEPVDPAVAVLRRADRGRKRRLLRLRYRRMAADPFAFFRGADSLFAAAWAGLAPPDPGPEVLVCGDLHLENLGAYRTEAGEFRFGLVDFDEAVVGPCALDVVRCVASVLLAAERWDLSVTEATGIALAYLDGYRAGCGDAEPGEVTPTSGHGAAWDLLGATAGGSQADLLGRLTRARRSSRRAIRRDRLHPALGAARAEVVRGALAAYLASVSDGEPPRLLDVTGRIAGVGSLGVRRYIVLIGDGDAARLLDVKECSPPSLLEVGGVRRPPGEDEACRVVAAQVQLQGHRAAGLGTLAIGRRPYRVRELIPEEHRASLDRLRRRPDRLRDAVAVAGRLTAWAHRRGARVEGEDRAPELARWACGPALDAVLASAARVAAHTNRDYAAFRRAYRVGTLGPGKRP